MIILWYYNDATQIAVTICQRSDNVKKLYALMATLVVLTLGACANNNLDDGGGDSGSTATDGSEITAWAWDPNFNIRALEIARDLYEGEAAIEIIDSAQDDIIQRLNVMLSSGTTNGLPNIVLIEDYRAQSFLQAYPDMFYDLSDYINSEDFAAYKIPLTSFEGNLYGVPFDTGVTGVYIRLDYLEAADFTVADVTNVDWNQLIDVAVAVKEATGKHLLTLDPNDLGIIRSMIQTAGSWVTEADGKTPNLAGNPYLETAFGVYKRLMEEDLVIPVTDWSQFVGAFNTGDVVSVPTGNWITPSVMAEPSQLGSWAVIPYPSLPGISTSVNASNLGGSSWYVLNVDGKEEAAEFLASTFGSNQAFYQTLLEEIGAMGTFVPALNGDMYHLEVEFFGGQKIYQDFARWTQEIPQVNYGLHTYVIEDILVVALQNYLGGQDLEAALAEAQSQAESQIN